MSAITETSAVATPENNEVCNMFPKYHVPDMSRWGQIMQGLNIQSAFDVMYINTPRTFYDGASACMNPLHKMMKDDSLVFFWSEGHQLGRTMDIMNTQGFKFHSVVAVVDYSPMKADPKKKSRYTHTPPYFTAHEGVPVVTTCEYLLLFSKGRGDTLLQKHTTQMYYNFPHGLRSTNVSVMHPFQFKTIQHDPWFATRPQEVFDSILDLFACSHNAKKKGSQNPVEIIELFGANINTHVTSLSPLLPGWLYGPLDATHSTLGEKDVVQFTKALTSGISKTKLQAFRSKLLKQKEEYWKLLQWENEPQGGEECSMKTFTCLNGEKADRDHLNDAVLHVVYLTVLYWLKVLPVRKKRSAKKPKTVATITQDSPLIRFVDRGTTNDDEVPRDRNEKTVFEKTDAVDRFYNTLKRQDLLTASENGDVEFVMINQDLKTLFGDDVKEGERVSILKLEFLVLRIFFPAKHKRRGIDSPSEVGEKILKYMGFQKDEKLARTEVVWLLNRHLKRNTSLKEDSNGRVKIVLNEDMKKMLGTTESTTDYFNLSSMLNQFFPKKSDVVAGKKRKAEEAGLA